ENVKATFDQIERFLQETDFTPVIVGLGEMGPMRGYIDVTGFDGLVSAGGMAPRYAGLYNPSQSDLDKFAMLETIERIVDRETFQADFGGIPEHYEQFPAYLLVAKEGYVFRGVGSMSRPLHKIPYYDTAIPLHTSLGTANSIVDVAKLVLDGLRHRKVALILAEGVGCETFPLNHIGISNTYRWHSYTSGDQQYLALTTGKHFTERPYNLAYRYYVADDEQKPYPFSGIYNEIPEDTIGERYHGKSAAVGNRGMLTNLASGADISLECFVRALYNHGAMAVLKV
ncbi:MAG: hypothetical protein JW981_00065, partial [Anaerolineae bacterium]|nr:hypothetical protein [Anaerolineae bacterium]